MYKLFRRTTSTFSSNARKAALVLASASAMSACGPRGESADSAAADSLAAAAANMIADTLQLESQSYAYECGDGVPFIAKVESDITWLTSAKGTDVLSVIASDSGPQYTDGSNTFWVNGDEAVIVSNGTRYENCKLMEGQVPWFEAKLRGVHFRGIGQEPGWTIEVIDGKDLVFVGDYGDKKVTEPAPIPVTTTATSDRGVSTTYKTDKMQVTWEEKRCSDTMSGEAFPYTVSVTVDGKRYSGCGKSLR